MYGRPILIANDRARTKYSLRGIIESHGIKESGWWIFKKRTPTVIVRLREEQVVTFNKIANNEMVSMDDPLPGISLVMNFGMTKEEIVKFPIGSEVGITFGYASIDEQFLKGADALKVLFFQTINQETVLENEV